MSSDLDLGASSDPQPELTRSTDAIAMADAQHEEKKKKVAVAAAVQLDGDGAPEPEPEDEDEDNGRGEIPEATPWMHPPQSSPSEITNDNDESSDPRLDQDVDVKVCIPKEAHDLRALATTRNKMSDRNKQQPNFCSVDVVGPDGVKKRFAPGTKAAFVVERFNCQLKDPTLPVVCIVACKDGEDPIEFGPNVELVSSNDSWTLKTLREVVQYVSGKSVSEDPIHKMKDAIKEGTTQALSSLKPVTKVPGAIFDPESANSKRIEPNKSTRKNIEDMDPLLYFGIKNWEDLYPGGKLPEGGSQDCSPSYIGKVTLMFIFMFVFAGGLSYILERMPDPTRPFY